MQYQIEIPAPRPSRRPRGGRPQTWDAKRRPQTGRCGSVLYFRSLGFVGSDPASGRDHLHAASPAQQLLLTVPEACAALRVSRWALYQLIRTQQLATIRIGRSRRVPVDAVTGLIEKLRVQGGA
ncbi:helix-turn-helix domain-containing protein [Micromonospora sp. NPDC005194]|uniref:helix-turn-helix domain-containing protein n=1 Tax=Micromonospora sp. NPDC005194 TaxID=3156870 RepID=UPI0033BF1D74